MVTFATNYPNEFMSSEEGRKLVQEIQLLGCSKYRIAKDTGASITSVRAWVSGWWNPSEGNVRKLHQLKMKLLKEQHLPPYHVQP